MAQWPKHLGPIYETRSWPPLEEAEGWPPVPSTYDGDGTKQLEIGSNNYQISELAAVSPELSPGQKAKMLIPEDADWFACIYPSKGFDPLEFGGFLYLSGDAIVAINTFNFEKGGTHQMSFEDRKEIAETPKDMVVVNAKEALPGAEQYAWIAPGVTLAGLDGENNLGGFAYQMSGEKKPVFFFPLESITEVQEE